MELLILEAKQELKRVDHLIFVTLKYTRTVDVLRSILQRLVAAYDFLFEGMLKTLIDLEKIETMPVVPALRVKVLLEQVQDETMQEVIKFYRHIRKLLNAPYKKNQEYRRHVNMEVDLKEGVFKLFIDTVEDYYHKTLDYVDIIEQNFKKWIGLEVPEEE